MAQPPAYARSFSFTDHSTNLPSTPQPGVRLDTEFNNIGLSIAGIRTNIALIQRDDGALANGAVGPDQLSTSLTLGLRSVSNWATATAYIVNDAVWRSNALYRCATSHTSAAAFPTDLAAGRWTLVTDLNTYAVAEVAEAAIGEIVIDEQAIADLIDAKADKDADNAFSAGQSIKAGAATLQADYLLAQPTDYGAGKPRAYLRKSSTAGTWLFGVEDGAGGSPVLNLQGVIQLNGLTPYTTANLDLTPYQTEADVRRLAIRYAYAR